MIPESFSPAHGKKPFRKLARGPSKAASARAQSAFAAAYREEARKLAALPEGVPAPRLLWVHDADDWVVLETEYVDARAPHRPWRTADLEASLDMLEEIVAGRWHIVERTRATRAGRFAMLERSGFTPQERTFRVVAPRTDELPRAVSRVFDVEMYVDLPEQAWQHPGT